MRLKKSPNFVNRKAGSTSHTTHKHIPMRSRLLLLLLALVALLTGCNRMPRKFVVGVSQCSMDSWRDKFNDELRTSALLSDSLTVIFQSANDDAAEQKRQLDQFIEQKVDLIVVSPVQLSSISQSLDEAHEHGIPVILYDRKADSDKYTAFVGCDNALIGQAMGSYIAQRLGGHGRVAEIRGLEGSSPAIERHRGFEAALKDYPGIELVASEAGDWKLTSGGQAMRQILGRTRDVDYVFAHNDRMAQGAREVMLAENPGSRCLFSGVDGLATENGGLVLVRDGVLDASYLYPTSGNEVADLALRILTGKPYEREINLQTTIVTRENVELSLMEARDAERQRANLGVLHQQVDSYVAHLQSQRVITVILVAFLVLLVALVVVVYRNLLNTSRLNHLLDERNERLRQLNEQVIAQAHSRLVFFTNVSHELRTPLTLIIDPVAQMEADTTIRGHSRELLALIKRNAIQLQQLVTTILDFRKIQNGKMTLSLAETDMVGRLRQWVDDFGPSAQRKRTTLHLDTDAFTAPTVVTDADKLSHIVFNLMSNALKYTPMGGDVFITLTSTDERFQISVRDTGKGIAPDAIPKVFERFFQANGSQAGTGVGLAVVKTYSELLQGTASVVSGDGRGAEFIVDLPLRITDPAPANPQMLYDGATAASASDADRQAADAKVDPNTNILLTPQYALPTDHATVLVIDDSDDIRTYLRTVLQPHYEVLEAADGECGLDVARSEVPDVILCDVMMPGIDGLEVCRTLKRNVATSHIPVIMLTAKALDSQRAEGYGCGADSYITKPFESGLLIARIGNLLRQRALLREKYASKQPDAEQDDPGERTFMQQLRHVIDSNMGDSEFSVEQLGAEMGLSRVQLYRKVKALTGTSAVDLLRRARLAKAHSLLQTTHRTIAEVAYDVGFSSPSYFAKCFKDEYGLTPGEMLVNSGR